MRKKEKREDRIKVIKDRDFYKLWKSACEIEEENVFFNENHEWPYKKYRINYDEYVIMLHNIHQNAHLPFCDIITKQNYTKAMLSNSFCIPIRTVEAWYYGQNKCPDYIRLMLIRYFHMFKLGKYIKVESEYKYNRSLPYIYEKKKSVNKKAGDSRFTLESIESEYAAGLVLSKTNYLDDIINKHKKKSP